MTATRTAAAAALLFVAAFTAARLLVHPYGSPSTANAGVYFGAAGEHPTGLLQYSAGIEYRGAPGIFACSQFDNCATVAELYEDGSIQLLQPSGLGFCLPLAPCDDRPQISAAVMALAGLYALARFAAAIKDRRDDYRQTGLQSESDLQPRRPTRRHQ